MPEFSFRPITHDDLPMLAEWLRDPQVAEWWPGPDHQISLVTEDFDNPAMRQLIALMNGDPIGYAQYYPAFEWPAPQFEGLPADTIAIDVFGAHAGRGSGGRWLRALGDLLVQETTTLAIDPDPENHRAIAAYQKAGFAGDTIRNDSEDHPCRIMTRLR